MIKKSPLLLMMTLLPGFVLADRFVPETAHVYKTINGADLKLYVFEPAGHQATDQTPAIIFFFGGGWSGGTPKQFYEQARYLADRGMVAISADYRVKSRQDTTPFECVKDGKSAIRWLRQHAREMGVDPNRIVASGGSAGGHVAACTGVIEGLEEAGEDLSLSSVPNAMILFNPVLDTTAKGFGLSRVGEDRQTEISPCHQVRPGIVPALLLHGTADSTVPFENAKRFAHLMKESGNRCELKAYEGQTHGFFNGSFFRSKTKDTTPYRQTMEESVAFLTKLGYLPSVPRHDSIKSPDGFAILDVSCTESELAYALSWRGETLLKRSVLSMIDNPIYSVVGVETREIDQSWKPVWGQFSTIRDHCREHTLKLKVSGVRLDLICRVYNDGVGLRFSVPDQAGLAETPWRCHVQYSAAGDFEAYWPAGESTPEGPVRLSGLSGGRSRLGGAPIVLDTGHGPWLAILESDLYSASLFGSARFSIQPETRVIQDQTRGKTADRGFVTPWKVILLGKSPGDLLVSHVSLNLAAPCKLTDTRWIKPGKGLWDWRIHGYDNGEFVYGIDTRSYLHLIEFCAAQGIEYLTIDDHWFKTAKDGLMTVAPEVDIEKVMQYARAKGVGVILYYDRKKGDFGDDHLFAHYHGLGAVGIKYGFMGNKADFTRRAIEQAAAEKQIIFFHDGPVPMTGVERSLPNLVSREYCHAQQDSRRAFTPTSFLKMAMINALTGPLDQANGNFGIKSINAGERQKGPRKKNSYISTVVSEVARTLVISSGLITLPDAPEEYLKKADLFEFLKQMPATWDETRVINSQMGEFITTARRSGTTWFVGSVNNESPRRLPVILDFLKPGMTYDATLFQDAKTSHGVNNPEAYDIVKTSVKMGDTVTAKMAMGGGHAMILQPEK